MIAAFIEERRFLKGVSPNTVEWYKNSFLAFQPYLADCRDESELQSALKKGVMSMVAAGTNPITLNDRIRCMNAWLHWLAEEHHTRERMRDRKVKEPQKVVQTLTVKQVAAPAAYRPRSLTGKRVHAAACLILDCGARLEEVLQLHIADLLLDDLLVRIHGKGGKERLVPISPGLRRVLWPWIRGKRPVEYVFATKGGTAISARNALRDLHIVFRRLGIQGSRLAGMHCVIPSR